MYSHFKQDASHNILEEYLRKFDVVKDENRKKKKKMTQMLPNNINTHIYNIHK